VEMFVYQEGLRCMEIATEFGITHFWLFF